MRLSSVFMICSGFANIGLAIIFYFYAFISYLSEAGSAGDLAIIGLMFTVIAASSFKILGRLGKKTRTLLSVALMIFAFIEFAFSFLFLFFAYGGGYLSLLEVGIPLLLASIFLFSSYIQKYIETKRKKVSHVKQPKTELNLHRHLRFSHSTWKNRNQVRSHTNVIERKLLDVNSWAIWFS